MPRAGPDPRRLRTTPSRARDAVRQRTADVGRAIAASARARRWLAVRAAAAIGLPMLIGAAAGHLTEGAQAALGSFVVLYGATEPYGRRAKLLGILVVAVTVAMILGTLVGGHEVAAVVVGVVGGIVWTLCAFVLRTGPPREYFVLLVYLLGTTMPADPGAWASRGATVGAGAALAWVIAMSPWAFRRPGPVPGIVAKANDAVAALLDAIGGPRARTAAHGAIVAVRAALQATDQARGPRQLAWSRRAVAIEQVLDAALALHVDDAEAVDPGWGRRLRDLARRSADGTVSSDPAAARAGPGATGSAATGTPATGTAAAEAASDAPVDPGAESLPVPDRPTGPLLVDAVARARAAWRATTSGTGPASDLDLSTSWRVPARWTLSLESPHPQIALRIGLAVGGGLGIGYVFGLVHPSWVGLSAASVLQARSVSGARARGIQRALGTALGVVVAGALFSLAPSDAVKVGAIIVLQFAAQLTMRGSYALAVVAITTMTLCLISLLGAGTVSGLLDARVLDTFIGCAFAGLLLVLTPPRKRTELLEEAQADALRAAGTTLVHALDPETGDDRLDADRRELHATILRLRAAEEAATGDAFGLDPLDDASWPLTATIDRLARLVLALPAGGPGFAPSAPNRATRSAGGRPSPETATGDEGDASRTTHLVPADREAADRLAQRFEAFARRVGGDSSPSPLLAEPVPLRSPLPRISEALEELRRQLADRDRPT